MKLNVIVDIDNTISIVGNRIKLLPNYTEFHKRCNEDQPINYIIELIQLLSTNYNIVFLTMRPLSVMNITKDFLNNFFLNYKLLMRDDNCIKDANIFKIEELTKNGYNKENIYIAIDDNDSVIKSFMNRGINCMKVPNSNNKIIKKKRNKQRI